MPRSTLFRKSLSVASLVIAAAMLAAAAPADTKPPDFEENIKTIEALVENSIWRVGQSGHFLNFTAVNARETMDDTKLAALTPLAPQVVDIDLSRTHITAAGLRKFLADAVSLETLNLSGTSVGADWIPEAGALPALKHLNLFATPLSDSAASNISQLKSLQSLHVSGTGLSSADLEKLRKIVPETTGDDFLERHAVIANTDSPPSSPSAKPLGENLALGKPVTATASYDKGAETFPAAKLTDGRGGDTGTPGDWSFWLGVDGDTPSITIDLSKPETIALIALENTRNRTHADRGTENFTIETSDDGLDFKKLVSGKLQPIASTDPASYASEKFPFPPVVTRFVRINIDSYHGKSAGLNEIRIYPRVEDPGQ